MLTITSLVYQQLSVIIPGTVPKERMSSLTFMSSNSTQNWHELTLVRTLLKDLYILTSFQSEILVAVDSRLRPFSSSIFLAFCSRRNLASACLTLLGRLKVPSGFGSSHWFAWLGHISAFEVIWLKSSGLFHPPSSEMLWYIQVLCITFGVLYERESRTRSIRFARIRTVLHSVIEGESMWQDASIQDPSKLAKVKRSNYRQDSKLRNCHTGAHANIGASDIMFKFPGPVTLHVQKLRQSGLLRSG